MKQSAHVLREHRQRTGETLDALAKRLETSKTTLSQIENGHREISLELLPKMVEATGIPARKLRPDLADLLRRVPA